MSELLQTRAWDILFRKNTELILRQARISQI